MYIFSKKKMTLENNLPRPVHASGYLTHFMPMVFLYPLKTSENQGFSVFWGYRKRPIA